MAGDGLREAAVEVMDNAHAAFVQSEPNITAATWPAIRREAESRALTALLALLDQRGFAVVPKVATEEMLRAGFSRFLPWGTSIELWRDQLAAAPNPLEAPDGQ